MVPQQNKKKSVKSWKAIPLGVVTSLLLLAPTSSALLSAPSPVGVANSAILLADDVVRICTDQFGRKDVYEVKDHIVGDAFTVTIMEGVYYSYVRAAWNAQIPRAHEGVNTKLSVVYNGATYVTEKKFDAAITGGCGQEIGLAYSGSMYEVRIDFLGLDQSTTKTNGQSVEIKVEVKVGLKFSLNPVKLAAVEVDITLSGTFSFWSETSTTLTPYHKIFSQGGYSQGPGVAGTVLLQLTESNPFDIFACEGDCSLYPDSTTASLIGSATDCMVEIVALVQGILEGQDNELPCVAIN